MSRPRLDWKLRGQRGTHLQRCWTTTALRFCGEWWTTSQTLWWGTKQTRRLTDVAVPKDSSVIMTQWLAPKIDEWLLQSPGTTSKSAVLGTANGTFDQSICIVSPAGKTVQFVRANEVRYPSALVQSTSSIFHDCCSGSHLQRGHDVH